MRIATSSIGYLEFNGNELSIVSTIDDPPKLRMASPSGSFGCISGNRLRSDGAHLEKVLLILKPDDPSLGQTHEGGKYDFFAQLAGTEDDAGMKRVHEIMSYEENIYVPLHGGSGGGGTPGPQGPVGATGPQGPKGDKGDAGSVAPGASSRFFSPNGRYCWNYQDDGHQVQYDTHNSTNEASWTAVWSNWHGLLKPLPWV